VLCLVATKRQANREKLTGKDHQLEVDLEHLNAIYGDRITESID
jgi:hypothetical protein